MSTPRYTFRVCPTERRGAVRVARGLEIGDESLKAQAYGHLAGMTDAIVEMLDPSGCYQAETFGELEVHFAQAADRSAVAVWGDAPADAREVIDEYLRVSAPALPTGADVDPGKIRLAQGINTATKTTRRLVQAMPGFVREQTDFEPLALEVFGTVAHNSWRVVMDRALLHLASTPYESKISHRSKITGVVDTMSFNSNYHAYDPEREIIETTAPFDDWQTLLGHRVADQAVVATPAIGCPATLMGPRTIRRVVDIFADVAEAKNLPHLPRSV